MFTMSIIERIDELMTTDAPDKRRKDDKFLRNIIIVLVTVIVGQGGTWIYNIIVLSEQVKQLTQQVNENKQTIDDLALASGELKVIKNDISHLSYNIKEIKSDLKELIKEQRR